MSYRLGIDTGGTFTDAVLLDEADQVVAMAKRLTTRMDLQQGIADAVAALPADLLSQVELVSLSSTLTTNSAVEGKGAPIGVLLIGYDERQVQATGLVSLLGASSLSRLGGGHDAGGHELAPLDEAALRETVLAWRERVSAFAVSASFSVRNPAHERRAAELVHELTGKPVTCGHELAASLGAPRRAMTAALNARMIAYVAQLIEAVRGLLHRHRITAPLMIVKGDGSLVSADSAILQPITTVLSGPAASVNGAMMLSGHRNLIVADMGGTTTDIAVVRDGLPTLSFDGARVGDWRPMVEAIKLYSIGLGGDSEVAFDPGRGLAIGPHRVVPMSLLASQHPELHVALQRQLNIPPGSNHNRFAMRLQHDEALLGQLSPDEHNAWARLAEGPVEMLRAVEEERWLARALTRLERRGLVIFSGFTPTDAAHVLGVSHHWDAEAARLAAIIWAKRMRRQYGLGRWPEGDAEAPSREIFARVVKAIATKLIEAGLHDADSDAQQERLAASLAALIMRGAPGAAKALSLFSLNFAPTLPIVAVGGPAPTYYPAVGEALGAEVVLPPQGEVANAVGTLLAQVVQRVHITVLQPIRGCFRVFLPEGPCDHSTLEAAYAMARQSGAERAEALAWRAGAAEVEVRFEVDENRVNNDIDGEVFFEARVTAVAIGPPFRNQT
ncbi:hydantoinase/oxoprolinase family protein [Halomonas campisalis]|uniref:Hydantoinase/oxoprolinase family protein n=1 Tax=Billgrantia campisalis TaxID=74661 RepID=A0ABS9PDK9_9GAMM|nr:hydantoinase/oxoprolinase family protein [Halomonas campisalis]MCG6659855.1 hydantoinase/oxoprolinase family protein [Halomonas campisalis]MDR5865037.1 hydantoinase/oxoprolinase family protein [Halomonas campisalis]